jgi:hypothetical protein
MKNRRKSKAHPFNTWLWDDKSSEIGIPSLHCWIIGWKILRNRNPFPSIVDYRMKILRNRNCIPPLLHYWMKNRRKSKFHLSKAWLFDEKSSKIEIPSLQCSIIRWKIIRNRNPIGPMLDYGIEKTEKSESHPSNAWFFDENILSLASTVDYDMSWSETRLCTVVYVRILSFHGTCSTGNSGNIRLYTARQHTAVIRYLPNGCSTARLR